MKLCECGAPVYTFDAPTWKEFRLFGVTWLIGRWDTHEADMCYECYTDKARDPERAAYYAGAEDGYMKGMEDARRGER